MGKMMLTGPLARTGVLLGVTAILGTLSFYKFKHAGNWLPANVPDRVGVWEAIDTPIPEQVLVSLGGSMGPPKAIGRRYVDAFGEEVMVSIIAAGAFENYHDPTVCVVSNGFFLTGKDTFKIDGPGSGDVRAMIFKQTAPNGQAFRILMYYWQQNRDGSTATEPVMGNYRDLAARFRTGFGAVVVGHQTCLVRAYAILGPDDTDGVQTQRNVDEISKAIYRALRKDGAQKS